MKLGILIGYKFLLKKLNFGVNQCISGHVILQSTKFIRLDITKYEIYKIGHISVIFKDRDFWFGAKNSIKLCTEHFTILGVIKYIFGHVTGHKLCF